MKNDMPSELNGKLIKCKNCNKEFYKSKSILINSKYCSWKCYLEYHRIIICKRCKEKKEKYKNTSYCFNCYIEIQREKEKNRIVIKDKTTTIKKLTCLYCKKEFTRPAWYNNNKFCGRTCYELDMKKTRKGKNNPNWRNGFNNYSRKHQEACAKYRKEFLEKYDYLYCEICGINNSLRFETHHIVFASEAPRHKELHNNKNLILLCIQCHNDLHSKKSLRNNIVIKRNLNELFGRNLIIAT